MIRLPALALCLVAPLSAQAEEAPVLARYWMTPGSLAPNNSGQTYITFFENGVVEHRHCQRMKQGPDCTSAIGQSTPEAREAIRTAAQESNLLANPAPNLLGSDQVVTMVWGEVFLVGGRVALNPNVARRDKARVGAVLCVIVAAIPADMQVVTTHDCPLALAAAAS
jgi:hypothetical protein